MHVMIPTSVIVVWIHAFFFFSVAGAFDLPSIFQLPTFTTITKSNSIAKTKEQLLQAVSFTANGKNASPETQQQVIDIVNRLETAAPPSPKLLLDPTEAQALDGVWFLQYTSPSIIGDADRFPNAWKPDYTNDELSTYQKTPFEAKGSVIAAGVTFDASNRVVRQCFDISKSTVTNDISLDFGRVCVSGSFRPSESVTNRAIVAFDTCQIILNNGISLDLGFVFTFLAFLRRSKDSGWLEITFLDDDMRIGRGNKGTLFVLTRKLDAVQP